MTLLEELTALRDRLNLEIKNLSPQAKVLLAQDVHSFDNKADPVWIQLGLSCRASNGLCRMGLVTIDLIYEAHRRGRLYPGCCQNFGKICIREISTKLVEHGFKPIVTEKKHDT